MRRQFGWIRRLPSKRYQATYIGPDGARHKAHSTFVRKSDAEAWLNAEERAIDEGSWTPPDSRRPNRLASAGSMTLEEYARANIRRRATRGRRPLKESTVGSYLQTLRLAVFPTLGATPLGALTPEAIQRWHDQLPPNPTQNGNAYGLLRSILNDAVDEGLIPANPCRIKGAGKPEPAREPEVLAAPVLIAYTLAAEEPYRAMLTLAAWCSLRSGEVRALRRCDVADDATVLKVEQGVTRMLPDHPDNPRGFVFDTPKSAAGRRTVAIPPPAQTELLDWLERHDATRGAGDLLFPAQNGIDPMHDGTLRKAHKRAAQRIGRASLTLHDLRRTGATLAGRSGATVKEIMRRLGHTRPDIAMLYQVADDERDRAVADSMARLILEA